MKRLLRTAGKGIAGIGLAGILLFSGCKKEDDKTQYLEGTVTKEAGNVSGIVKSDGAWFGNESVRIGEPKYSIQVKTDKGIYTMSINGSYNKPLESLALAIDEGTKIRFVVVNRYGKSSFSDDGIGKISADDINILRE